MRTLPAFLKQDQPKSKLNILIGLGIVSLTLFLHLFSLNSLLAFLILGISSGIIYYSAGEFQRPRTRFNQLLAGSILFIIGGSISELLLNNPNMQGEPQPPKASIQTETAYDPVKAEISIVKTEDQSHKIIPGSIYDYTPDELAKRPIDKKMAYRLVIETPISNEQVRPIIEDVVRQIQNQDPDIDEMTFWLWSDKNLLYTGPDIGQVTWAPQGELGHVTDEIALQNDRSGYETHVKVIYQGNLEQYMKQKQQQETKFGYTETQRREIWKALIAAEALAEKQAEKRNPQGENPSLAQIRKQGAYQSELEEMYKRCHEDGENGMIHGDEHRQNMMNNF